MDFSNYKLLLLLVIQNVLVFKEVKCNNYFEVTAEPSETLAKYVSSLIEIESSKDSTRNHDVALIRMEKNSNSEAFSAISSEVLKSNPGSSVFIHSTRGRIADYRIHAASVFVISTEYPLMTELKHDFIQIFLFNWWTHYAKFIFVLVDEATLNDELLEAYSVRFRGLGMSKVIITVPSGEVWTFDKRRRLQSASERFDPFCDIDCMRHNALNVIVGRQPPRVYKSAGKYIGVDLKILEMVAERQNWTTHQAEVLSYPLAEEVRIRLGESRADVEIFTTIKYYPETIFKTINTNDENAYCALIPIPPPLTFLHFLLKPFDDWSWVVMLASIAACAVLWQRVTKSFKSAFYFVFFVIVSLVGQIIPLKVSKPMLKSILQMCVLMTFILGSAYQSLIISYLTNSRNGIRLKNFDELFASDRTLVADEVYQYCIKGTVDDSVMDRIRLMDRNAMNLDDYIGMNIAIIHRCDSLQWTFSRSHISDDFYILPDKSLKFLEKFYTAFQSPFHEIIQNYFDRTFETGIRQYWQNQLKPRYYAKQTRDVQFVSKEQHLLRLDDLHGVFKVLFIGLGIAFVVWVFEINWKRLTAAKCARKSRYSENDAR